MNRVENYNFIKKMTYNGKDYFYKVKKNEIILVNNKWNGVLINWGITKLRK